MLVLTRKKGEAILIGEDIIIKVVECDGDKIRLGIEAPKNVKVMRMELLEETVDINLESAKQNASILDELM